MASGASGGDCRPLPVIDAGHAHRLTASYGTQARMIVDGVVEKSDLGPPFGADLYEREVDYLRRNEWAMTAEDIVWRRSKLGLRLTGEEVHALAEWLDGQRADAAPRASV